MVTPVTSLTTRVKDVVLSTSLMVEKYIMIFFAESDFLRYIIKLLPKIHFVFFRREAGNCRICYSADAVGDVNLGGKATKVVTKVRCMFYVLNELQLHQISLNSDKKTKKVLYRTYLMNGSSVRGK